MTRAAAPRLARRRGFSGAAVAIAVQLVAVTSGAESPVVDFKPNSVRIVVDASTVFDALDALGRAAGFRVSYEGSKPARPLHKVTIEGRTPAQAVFRLLEGQHLNYGVIFDAKGQKILRVMILGAAPASSTGSAAGSQAASPPSRVVLPPPPAEPEPRSDDEADEEDDDRAAPPATPAPPPQSAPLPAPTPPSPFGPRPLGQPVGPTGPFGRPGPPFSPTPATPAPTPVPTPNGG